MSDSTPRPGLVFLLALLADVAAIVSLMLSGAEEGVVILVASVATVISFGGATVIARQSKRLKHLAWPVRYVEHFSDALRELSFTDAKALYCLASGTETYYGLIEPRVREGMIKRGTTIHLGYRVGDAVRAPKLAEYNTKWLQLAKRSAVEVQFYPIEDFDHALRGVVIDDLQGAIGFYFREDRQTIGGDSGVVIVDRSSAVGVFLIDSFLRVFGCRRPQGDMAHPAEKDAPAA